MILLGVTGGIGMGKSTAARILTSRGLEVADTDLIAREIVEPGMDAWSEIRREFGDSILAADDRLDRARLADLVFNDAAQRRRLEEILHPRIRAEWERRVATWQSEGRRAAAVVIPLLFETQAGPRFHATVCVACSAATQAARLHQRGWSDEHRRQRLAAQMPIEEKIERSALVVWTDLPEVEHARQWDSILGALGVASACGS